MGVVFSLNVLFGTLGKQKFGGISKNSWKCGTKVSCSEEGDQMRRLQSSQRGIDEAL